ncbi:hypothetical protein BJG92_01459 [Arthrobacter sp. SO5]|uniref:hypothetical protein n=1 Tax=Arthrobacter sp. SO5 TaxID=1897055 RepID=UPI001E37E0EC|nr:hypothetical protein [Arthrobacter sp. SO5]MCB5273933.1 hypothetical protein [Arthrobacter sp. SO5]
MDGKLPDSIDRDMLRRRVVITDYAGTDGLVVEHKIGFDRCGRLTSRTRGGRGLYWEYDGDGNRTRFTDAYGTTTTYTRDATGLRPLTDDELKAHDGSSRGAFAAAGDWINENREYIGAAVLVAAGVALMCTGVGGPVGLVLVGAASGALVSAGASIGRQQATTGTVDWGRVGRDAPHAGAELLDDFVCHLMSLRFVVVDEFDVQP